MRRDCVAMSFPHPKKCHSCEGRNPFRSHHSRPCFRRDKLQKESIPLLSFLRKELVIIPVLRFVVILNEVKNLINPECYRHRFFGWRLRMTWRHSFEGRNPDRHGHSCPCMHRDKLQKESIPQVRKSVMPDKRRAIRHPVLKKRSVMPAIRAE